MDLRISFNEHECDRLFSQMQELMQSLQVAYGNIISAKGNEASQWGADSGKTFNAHMSVLAERLARIEGRWQNLVSRYEKARDCVRLLNQISFS